MLGIGSGSTIISAVRRIGMMLIEFLHFFVLFD